LSKPNNRFNNIGRLPVQHALVFSTYDTDAMYEEVCFDGDTGEQIFDSKKGKRMDATSGQVHPNNIDNGFNSLKHEFI
jgi:hypothetical protein